MTATDVQVRGLGAPGDGWGAAFYAAIRFEGGLHGVTGVMEPDLELTNNLGLVASSNTGQNETFGYMGRLDVLIEERSVSRAAARPPPS